MESGLITKNPFAEVKSGVEVNEERFVYVDNEMIQKVMACCRDDHDRLLLALARFAGFRITSEVRHMRYSDFTKSTIRIHAATKTGAREVPLFCEVRKILDRIVASQGENYNSSALVFRNLGGLRVRMIKAIEQSGVKRWTKLFVNLRSSCITDLAERGYPEKTMDAIFGNSSVVRMRHYIQFRKEREYVKVLSDDAALHEFSSCSGHDSQCCFTNQLRDRIMSGSVTQSEFEEISVLMKMLLDRFGIDGKAA